MADYRVDINGKVTKKKKEQTKYRVDINGEVTKTEDSENRTYFQKGAFRDGYQFGDVLTSVGNTIGDASLGILQGAGNMVEGVVDLGMYGVAGISDLVGADSFADDVKNVAKKNAVDGWADRARDFAFQDSLLGEKSVDVASGLGQVGVLLLTGGAGQAAGIDKTKVSALSSGTMFASSAGAGMSEAYQGGASDSEAVAYGALKGVVDAGTELLFGGLGKTVKALGISKGISSLDDIFAKKISSKISNQALKTLTQYGVKAAGEGAEEVLAGLGSAVAKKMTYMSDTELKQLVKDEKLLDQFIMGAITSGIAQGGDAIRSLRSGTDYVTGLTKNEELVVEKEAQNRIAEREAKEKLSNKEKNEIYEQVKSDLFKGRIDIDTIESALGGETYKNYMSVTEQETALQKEYDTLNKMKQGEMTGEQSDRREELKQKLQELKTGEESSKLKEKLYREVSLLAETDRLSESYREKERRSQSFEVDLTKYSAKQQPVVKKAVESGILNNTNWAHEFVDMVAKISADKGVSFDFTNNKRLKESGFALEGKTVNGFLKDGNISLNIESKKALNAVVGHEITHVLEGTELYGELQQIVKSYVESKGEYGKRLETIQKLYEGVEGANIENELTADLIGDYLFTDSDFVNRLSTEKPGLFKRIFEEIKYLLKKATAGSKQARELEKVKRTFEKAYRESGTTANADGKTKYSINSKFYEQLDSWDGKTEGFAFVVGETSEALQIAGIPRKQIRWDASKIATLLKKHSGMTRETVKGIPELLENPVIVIDSKKGDNSKIVMGELYDENGKVVTAVLLLTPTSKKGNVLDLVKISSAEGRSHINSLFTKEDGTPVEVRYVDKKRIQNWLNVNRLQLPLHNHIMDSNDIIPQIEENASGKSKQLSLGGDNASIGGYNIRSKDIALGPVRKDIAPVQQQKITKENLGPVRKDIAPVEQKEPLKDIGPVRSDIIKPDVPNAEGNAPAEQYSPDELPTWEDVKEKPKDTYAPEPENYPKKKVTTVKERNAAKLQSLKVQLKNEQDIMEKSHASYNAEIRDLQSLYDSKKNKNTRTAQELLDRIERRKNSRDNTDAYYEKRISDIKKKIGKMSTKEFKIVEQRQSKEEEYQTMLGDLIGDTSTWVDKKMGIYYKVNTLRRNLRDIVRDENGNRDTAKADAIYDEIQGKYNHNEAKLNREANEIRERYAELKITAEEDAYIQMLGEYRHNPDTTLTADAMEKYYEKHKAKIDTKKVDEIIASARQLYDELFRRVNATLEEQGMRPIEYREGYFPHFTDDKQSWLAKLLNWKTRKDEIPTDIAGLTEQFKPVRSYQSFDKHRTGDSTDYSFKKGLDMYVQGALDWIYHIEDIQKRRAFENEIRYRHSDQGVKDKVEAIRNNLEYDASEVQDQIDLVYKEARNPLNNFISDFRTQTNTLAGKKSSMDRGAEEWTNRKFYSTMSNISNRVTANMVVGSFSSALTNFIPITQSWAEVSPVSSLLAMQDTIKSYIRKDSSAVDNSDFLTNRLRKSKKLYQSTWDKIIDKAGFMMEAVDNFTSQVVWRSKYLENMKVGMSENEAIKNADQFAENVLAGRSRGNNPTIFDAKNPFIKIATAFQLEVNNQYGYLFKDVPQDIKNEAKGNLLKSYAGVFIGAWVYNLAYSALTGRDAALDPIGIIADILRDFGMGDDEEPEEPAEIVGNLAESVLEELPFVGGLLGGGRIPISSALPYDDSDDIVGAIEDFLEDAQNWKDGGLKNIGKELANPVSYLLLPAGGGQIRKTIQGLKMYDDDLPIAGSYTNSGKLRFSVNDTPLSKLQAALFGQWSSKNAREYIEEGRTALGEKQTQELIDSGLPMADYWKYRDGLKGKSGTQEKIEYIAGLDLPITAKNVLVNNAVDRETPVDLTEYDRFAGYEEFDFFSKNKELYKFLQDNGVSYADYKVIGEEGQERYEKLKKDPGKQMFLKEIGVSVSEYCNSSITERAAYDWAYKNPEEYRLSQIVTPDVMEYKRIVNEINDITSDRNKKGKTIRDSKKKKIFNYIKALEIDYGQKMILFRSIYNDDDTYNYEIVEYLNERNDISRTEAESILKSLGLTVHPDGRVTW